LHVACAYDCLAMVQLLMHYGADPLAEDNHGRTPQSMATGNTQRFLQRMLAKSTKEQRGIIRRLFSCHTAAASTNNSSLMHTIRKKIGGNILSPHVDDGQMRKIRRLTDTQLKAELRKVGIVAGPMCVREEFKLDGVSAFCYLLLDPRRICDDVESLDLKSFVPAIFYVGKGTKARPLAHLIEAKREKAIKSPKTVSNRKLQRIDSIWEHGRGVLCLQINHNVSDDEAFVREAALIEAIKLENLTNVKGGKWRGKSKAWTLPMKAEFGTYQLLRAMGVLKIEGIRPIFPQALPDSLYPFAQKKNAKT
uniref:GIY-YIG domain-containing protein n=1 Tax=Heligmosomoides polygyrus TaxID=6339 RepID=A0A8L8KC89_HELPZ